jgi:hypothetical protein
MDPNSKKRGLDGISRQGDRDRDILFNQDNRDAEFIARDDESIRGEEQSEGRSDVQDESDDGEDLLENMEDDYAAKPGMDAYDDDQIDDNPQRELSYDARVAVEHRLNQEDRLREMANTGRRMPGAFADDVDIDDDHEEMQARLRQDRFRMMREEAKGEGMDNVDMDD